MKSKVIFICLATMLALIISNQTISSPKVEIGKKIVKFGGALMATATSFAHAGNELEEWIDKKFDVKRLKQYEGYDGKVAKYSLDVDLDGDAVSEFFGFIHPDIYFVIDIEGQGKFILPDVEYSFKGGQIMRSFLANNYKPGSKIKIDILDSDETSNAMLNNFLRTKVTANGEINVNDAVRLSSSASIQLVQDGQTLVLNAPDTIYSGTVFTPKEGAFFEAKGEISDGERKIGSIKIKKEWEEKVSKSIFSSVFYLIISLGLLVGLITYFYKKIIKTQPAV
jgi:hypothetical protein